MIVHTSDCAAHNAPETMIGPCDCSQPETDAKHHEICGCEACRELGAYQRVSNELHRAQHP